MNAKKRDCANSLSSGSFEKPSGVEQNKPDRFKFHKVEFYKSGVALVAPSFRPYKPPPENRRGTVKGWSKASRRRMREFLLTSAVKPGFDVYAVTFTYPGPVLSVEETKRLFNNFQMSLHRAGGCAVWRAEVQSRGAIHWHMIAGLPACRRPASGVGELSFEDSNSFLRWSCHKQIGREKAYSALRSGLWVGASKLSDLCFAALDTLGEVRQPIKDSPDDSILLASRSLWIGALQHSILVEVPQDQLGAWMRYLQDHTTKSKQDQIATDFGRHWGVVGRKHFDNVFPDSVAEFSLRQYAKLCKAYNRLCTPYIRCSGALFGKKRGFSPRRGRSGRSVCFCNTETMRRLVEWASSF